MSSSFMARESGSMRTIRFVFRGCGLTLVETSGSQVFTEKLSNPLCLFRCDRFFGLWLVGPEPLSLFCFVVKAGKEITAQRPRGFSCTQGNLTAEPLQRSSLSSEALPSATQTPQLTQLCSDSYMSLAGKNLPWFDVTNVKHHSPALFLQRLISILRFIQGCGVKEGLKLRASGMYVCLSVCLSCLSVCLYTCMHAYMYI